MNKNFCYAPFVHMYLHDKYDRKLCCVSEDTYDTKKSIPDDLDEYWTSDFYQLIRKKMLDNQHVDNCIPCYNREAVGEVSERDRYTMMFENRNIEVDFMQGNQYKTPLDFELRPGNLCNLKCRMCEPNSSSQLDKEYRYNKELFRSVYNKKRLLPSDDTYINIDDKNIEYILKNAEHINQIKLLGGEPTIMSQTIEILETLIDRNILDITMHITTNCTNANEKFLELIQNFNNICYNFSIDGTSKTLEYIRYPIHFNKLTENMQVLCKGVPDNNAQILYTLQAYNLPNVIDFLKWVVEMHDILQNNKDLPNNLGLLVSDLIGPEWASIQGLPIDVRNNWLDSALNNEILNHFSNSYEEVIDSNFKLIDSNIKEVLLRLRTDTTQYSIKPLIDITKRFDIVRKQHIKDFIPEIWEIMDHAYYDKDR
jgi:organic radical activating enzyme